MDPMDCPDRAELEAFAVGSLPDPAHARGAGHIEGCGDCEAALDALDHRSDPLVSGLRGLDRTKRPRAESVPEGWLAAARSCRDGPGVGSWASAEARGRRLGRFELRDRLGAGSF